MEKRDAEFALIERMSLAGLEANRSETARIIGAIAKKIVACETQEDTLRAEKSVLEKSKQEMEQRYWKIRECILVHMPLPGALLSLRTHHLEAKARAKSTDSITEQSELHEKARYLLGTLQNACDHRFVLTWSGYEGSRSRDHDDAYRGHRVCLVCDLSETSESTRKGIYRVLVGNETRLVKRVLTGTGRVGDFRLEPLRTIEQISAVFTRAEKDIVHFPEESVSAGEKDVT